MDKKEVYEKVKIIEKEKRIYDAVLNSIEENPVFNTSYTTEQLYKKSKMALRDALLDKDFITKVIDAEINFQENEKQNPNLLSEFIKHQKEAINNVSEDFKDFELSEEEKQFILDTYSRDISEEEIINAIDSSIKEILKSFKSYLKAYDTPKYIKYVNDLVDNVYLNYDFFVKHQNILDILLHHVYVRDKEKNQDSYILHFSREYQEDIYNKLSIKKQLLNNEDKKEDNPVISYIQEELSVIEYDDKAIMYRNALTNIISKEQNELLQANKDVEIKPVSIEKNKEIISEKLEPFDLQVLDFIIDKIYKRGLLEFTDTQIATYMYEEKGQNAHIEDRRKVNESILKIQNVRLNLEFKYKLNNKAKIWSNNPLIWLKHVGANIDSEVNKYRILGKPFYLDFNELSETKRIEYPRKILYSRSNNKYKTMRSHNIRIYLVEIIKTLPNEDKHYIDIDKLYRVMDITSEKYPSYNSFKKERSKGLRIIKDALIDIKKEGVIFYYSEDNVGRTIKGYWISKKPILEENKTNLTKSNTENGN